MNEVLYLKHVQIDTLDEFFRFLHDCSEFVRNMSHEFTQ